MVFSRMTRIVVKVDSGKSSFRIVIPRKLIQDMAWENVKYILIEKHLPYGLKIRSLLYDEKSKGIDN